MNEIGLKAGDREDILDRVISNSRLIGILQEKDQEIYRLEMELSKFITMLNNISQLQSLVSEIPSQMQGARR